VDAQAALLVNTATMMVIRALPSVSTALRGILGIRPVIMASPAPLRLVIADAASMANIKAKQAKQNVSLARLGPSQGTASQAARYVNQENTRQLPGMAYAKTAQQESTATTTATRARLSAFLAPRENTAVVVEAGVRRAPPESMGTTTATQAHHSAFHARQESTTTGMPGRLAGTAALRESMGTTTATQAHHSALCVLVENTASVG
jgi:hypothetical protein